MGIKHEFAKDWLHHEYEKRRNVNGSFSMRAFARLLQVPASRLCDVLNGKRPLTVMTGAKIAERLKYSPQETKAFLECVTRDYQRVRGDSQKSSQAIWKNQQLPVDAYFAISDWYHFAILSLMETQGFQFDIPWISQRLGLTFAQTQVALERLQRLGLIEVENDQLKSFHSNLTTTHDVKSEALRNGHRQMLTKAIESLDEISIEERDITAITLAIHPKKIKKAKSLIKDFRRKLSQFLESGPGTEVYTLSIQLFPLTKKSRRNK